MSSGKHLLWAKRLRNRKSFGLVEQREDKVSGKSSRGKYIVQAAIDFGTTYSGIAFSFKHEYDSDPTTIHANGWGDAEQGRMHEKTPSCLLLKPDKSLQSFGHQAMSDYKNLVLDKKHDRYYFFWHFKMTLHQHKEINKDYQLTAENGKKVDALTVFMQSIKYLKDHLNGSLKRSMPNILDSDVGWVLTVPAIWNDSAKKFMRLAASKAGINNDQLEIALEPEAASLYGRLLPVARDPQTPTGVTKLPVGSKYMILDCGGGTVDITVHEVLEENCLKELYKATGGNWGGNVVNKSFMGFMAEIVGPDVFHRFCQDHKNDYLELVAEFEAKKRSASPSSNDKVTMRLPLTLQNLFNNHDGKQSLDAYVSAESRYKSKVQITGDKIRIQANHFRGFFADAVRGIVQHVVRQLKDLPKLNAVLMVGGFSESPILQDAIKQATESENLDVILPGDASLCVLKGAVLYGHEPLKITERKARFTFGVAMVETFDKALHPREKKIEIDGEELCNDVFDKHITIGDTVKPGEAQVTKTYCSMIPEAKFYPVVVFRSTIEDPKFVDDVSCDCIGYFLAPRPSGGCDSVNIRLLFGDSDIRAEVMKTDGSVDQAHFNF